MFFSLSPEGERGDRHRGRLMTSFPGLLSVLWERVIGHRVDRSGPETTGFQPVEYSLVVVSACAVQVSMFLAMPWSGSLFFSPKIKSTIDKVLMEFTKLAFRAGDEKVGDSGRSFMLHAEAP